MSVYHCLACDTLHGWRTHPAVSRVALHHGGMYEIIWWCPGCGQEHRSTDGTALRQRVKRWKPVEDIDAWLEARTRDVAVGFWWDPWRSRPERKD